MFIDSRGQAGRLTWVASFSAPPSPASSFTTDEAVGLKGWKHIYMAYHAAICPPWAATVIYV